MGNSSSKKETSKDVQNLPFTPTGLYGELRNWDLKVIRRLILNKKLAPLYVGEEKEESPELEECPICFLFYPGGLNRSTCCKKGICTECLLQIKSPNVLTNCPFCNRSGYSSTFSGPLSKEEREKLAEEQQKVIELKIRMRQDEQERDKQREQERALRKASGLTTSSNSLGSQAHPTPLPSSLLKEEQDVFGTYSQSLPTSMDAIIRDRENPVTFSTSYPPISINSTNNSSHRETEVDLEELMLMEAIRLSLKTSSTTSNSDSSLDIQQELEKDNFFERIQQENISQIEVNTPTVEFSLSEDNSFSFSSANRDKQEESQQRTPLSQEEVQEQLELALAIQMSLQLSQHTD